jgi:hypothetical protein
VEVEDFAVVGVVAAALELFAGVVVGVELVVLELLLPQPAISAPQSSVTASFENRPAVTFSPFGCGGPCSRRWMTVGGPCGQGYLCGRMRVVGVGCLGPTKGAALTSTSRHSQANAIERSRPCLLRKQGVCPVCHQQAIGRIAMGGDQPAKPNDPDHDERVAAQETACSRASSGPATNFVSIYDRQHRVPPGASTDLS